MTAARSCAVLAGLGFAAIASGFLGGSSQTFGSIALPILIGALFYAILALGRIRNSRIAYVIALLLGIVPALSYAYLVVTDTGFAFQLIPILLALPAVMIVAGLTLDWRAFWQRMARTP